MKFNTFNLHPLLLKAVEKMGYVSPTPIQSQAIPVISDGSDLRASAQTGTGKTAAFLLPALQRLSKPSLKKGKGARVLILAPTRELAMQITAQAKLLSQFMNKVKTVCLVGGVPYPQQTRQLSGIYDILIATPGRLLDFIEKRKIDFSRLEVLILDEADRMLDMGFMEDVERIVNATPKDRQTLLFSATLQGEVLEMSNKLMHHPKEISIASAKERHADITQNLHYVDDLYHKNRLLDHLLANEEMHHTIVFTATKIHADQLVEELSDKGHRVAALHGDMNQRQRTRTLTLLRSGKIDILVATDVAARGIDVQTISHVINFDLPRNAEDYVHRIGRTGRAGAKGTAFSFVSHKDSPLLDRIEKFTGYKIEVVSFPGLEAQPKQQRPKKARNRKFPKRSKVQAPPKAKMHQTRIKRGRKREKAKKN